MVWLGRGAIAVFVAAVVATIALLIVNGPHIRAAREAELARIIDEENRMFCAKFGAGPDTGHYAECAAALNGIRTRLEVRNLERGQRRSLGRPTSGFLLLAVLPMDKSMIPRCFKTIQRARTWSEAPPQRALPVLACMSLLSIALLATPNAAASSLDDCTQTDDMHRVITGCTRVTEEDWASPAQLAMALNNRGNAHEAMDHLDQAESDYNRAIVLNPHYANPYFNRGLLHARLGHFDRALSDFNAVLILEDGSARAVYMRGYIYEKLGYLDLAIADFSRVLELDPGDVQAFNNRGVAHRKKRNFERAIADFDAALALEPTYVLARTNRARVFIDLADADKAIAELSAVLALRPRFVEAYLARAETYERLDQRADALADYRHVLELLPSSRIVAGHIARLQAGAD